MRIVENRKCSRLLSSVSFGLLVLMIRVNVLVSCSLEKLWALFLQYVISGTNLQKIPKTIASFVEKIQKCITIYMIFALSTDIIEDFFVILHRVSMKHIHIG